MVDRTDTFIREVEEELRREQFLRLWQSYGTYMVAAVVLLVLAVAGYKYYEYSSRANAEASGARYEAALRLVNEGKPEEAQKAFESIAKNGPAGYATLAKMRLAAEATEAGRTAEAVAAYEDIAAGNATSDTLLRDYAALRAAALRVDTADWTEMQNRLNDLTNDRNPWRASARELLGLAAYKAGKLDVARREFERLLGDPATPPSMTERVQLMLGVLTEAEAGKGTPAPSGQPAPAKTE